MTIHSVPPTYGGAGSAPPPPQPTPAAGLPGGGTFVDGAQAAAVAASNIGVSGDVQSSALEDLDRRMRALEAARKFPAQDADGAQQLQGVGAQGGAQQATQLIQQMASGIAGAIGGAVGGIMK